MMKRRTKQPPARRAFPWHDERAWFLLWAGLIVASALITFDPKLYINGDNVDYIRLAEATRHGDLWASAKYPPLFPWFLTLPQVIFGVSLLPQKILVTIFYIAAGILLLRRARKHLPRPWGEPIGWVAITLVPVLEFGHYVMSEIPYLFFSLVALELYDKSPKGRRWVTIATALAAAATFYTRSVGLSMWGAILLSLLVRRESRRKSLLLFGAASMVLVLPWLVRSAFGPPNPYFRQLVQVNAFHPEFGLLDAAGWIRRIGINANVYLLGEIPMALLPIRFRWSDDPAELRYSSLPAYVLWLPLLLLAIGLIRSLRRGEPLGIYVVLY
jgi:4-amino-4-deoxy-L-arabinose transferase-like glycosyltransferase